MEGTNAKDMAAVFVLGWCTRFAASMSSACESFQRRQLFQICQSHKAILPWLFCTGSYHTRWLSVHYRDMCELPSKHPDVHTQFSNGSFVVHKTKKCFSSIALDHAHEQVSAWVRGARMGCCGTRRNPCSSEKMDGRRS